MLNFVEFAKRKDEMGLPMGSGKKVPNVGPDAQVWGVPGDQPNQKKSKLKEGFRSYHDMKQERQSFTAEELEQMESFVDAPDNASLNNIRNYSKKRADTMRTIKANKSDMVNYDNTGEGSTDKISVDKDALRNAANRRGS